MVPGMHGAQLVDTRSHYLHQGLLMRLAAAGHEYTFVRDAFWQKRRALIRRRRAGQGRRTNKDTVM